MEQSTGRVIPASVLAWYWLQTLSSVVTVRDLAKNYNNKNKAYRSDGNTPCSDYANTFVSRIVVSQIYLHFPK